MADPNAFLHDPRRRNLAILAVVAAIMVVLAALALLHQASLVAPKYTPRAFFPDLAASEPSGRPHPHRVEEVRRGGHRLQTVGGLGAAEPA